MDWSATFEPVWTVSLMPSNATGYMQLHDAVDGDLVARDPVGLLAAARSDEDAPLKLLPYLALERSVDEYSGTWPEARRRVIVRGSFGYHRVKGTRAALVGGLAPAGFDVRVVEWFEVEPPRPPNTFRLSVNVGGVDEWANSNSQMLLRYANQAKNAHTKIELVEVVRPLGPAAVYVGGLPKTRRTLRVGLPRPDEIYIAGITFIGAFTATRRKLRVFAQQ